MNYSEQNLMLAKQIIELQIENAQPKRVFEEIGANTKIIHTLLECSWSSSIIHKGLCSYNQQEQIWNPIDDSWTQKWRSVSPEFILSWLSHYWRQYPNQSLVVNSFQTEEDITKVTHGRIGIKNNWKNMLYHTTIPDYFNRRTFQEIVGNIWLQLITQCLDPEYKVTTPYIDHVYEDNQQNILKTIELMQHDSVVCITKEWKLCRIEDLTRTRGYQPLIILKWSFNPPHNGHLHMIETVQKKYPNHIPLAGISINNFNKGLIPASEIVERIEFANAFWYPVVVFHSPLFKDNIDRLRLKNKSEIILPVWSDIIQNIIDDYAKNNNESQMIEDFKWVRFEAFWREQFSFDSSQYAELFIPNDKTPYSTVSSTEIRADIAGSKHILPKKVRKKALKKYWH